MARSRQISESIGLGLLLALAGGFMDAYSYIERGQVFANAQTGTYFYLELIFRRGTGLSQFSIFGRLSLLRSELRYLK